jgi:predicted alpha/beta hydrolase
MQTHTIKTKAEKEITLTIFNSTNTDSTLIIVPATGVKQTFYQNFAQYFAEQGVTVITFDYHGIGKSLKSSIKKAKTTAEEWGSHNLESVIQFAIKNSQNSSIYLIGHSIGGQLIGLSPSSFIAKSIFLISAQSGYWKFWSGLDRYKLWSYWNVLFPVLSQIFGYLPSRSFSKMENLPKGVAMQWSKWCASPNYLFDSVPPHSLHFGSITS